MNPYPHSTATSLVRLEVIPIEYSITASKVNMMLPEQGPIRPEFVEEVLVAKRIDQDKAGNILIIVFILPSGTGIDK